MIIKQYKLNKTSIKDINFFLLYGSNEGLIEETLNKIFKPNVTQNIIKYDENEILASVGEFKENIYNKSFFESDKLVIINRATDKFLPIIKDIIDREIADLKIILKSGLLEKKSKLRDFFEKNDNSLITPFYEDDYRSLLYLTQNFLSSNKIKISSQNINLLIERCNGSRIALNNEIEKILHYSQKKKVLTSDDILRLTNSSENIEISELTNQCIVKNKKKTLSILNDNILSTEDNIPIIKNFLYKLKRLKKLKIELEKNKEVDVVLSNFKPVIFWKDKDILKQQLKICSINDINLLIKKINKIELMVKKNSQLSNQIVSNFIMERFELANN
tara:strand:- start:1807 stop:2802 length:996 start_codon:yes stop_codon:yes gene_type:complete